MIHHGLSDHTLLRPKPQKHPSDHWSQPEDVCEPGELNLEDKKTLGDVQKPQKFCGQSSYSLGIPPKTLVFQQIFFSFDTCSRKTSKIRAAAQVTPKISDLISNQPSEKKLHPTIGPFFMKKNSKRNLKNSLSRIPHPACVTSL